MRDNVDPTLIADLMRKVGEEMKKPPKEKSFETMARLIAALAVSIMDEKGEVISLLANLASDWTIKGGHPDLKERALTECGMALSVYDQVLDILNRGNRGSDSRLKEIHDLAEQLINGFGLDLRGGMLEVVKKIVKISDTQK